MRLRLPLPVLLLLPLACAAEPAGDPAADAGRVADPDSATADASDASGDTGAADAPDAPPQPVTLDEYGGVSPAAFEATGFFRVDEDERGRAWLVTPAGGAFYSAGVNHVNPVGYHEPASDTNPYHDAVLAELGTDEAWAARARERLAAWGWNTVGAWSDVDLFAGRLATTVILDVSGADWLTGAVPDYFSDEWAARAATLAAGRVAPRKDDPWLLGWFLDNELRWGADHRSALSLLEEYLALPAGAAGRERAVDVLAARYDGDVAPFNAAWGTAVGAFDDLRTAPRPPRAPRGRPEAVRDDIGAFLSEVAERYFAVGAAAVREADPNHLVLGVRSISVLTPPQVVEAAGRHVDVYSVNNYTFVDGVEETLAITYGPVVSRDGWLAQFHALSGRPLLVSEFSFRAADGGVPNRWPPIYPTVPDQAARADAFEDYATRCLSAPFIVGHHWYAYMDEPARGRFDGEDSNFGLVDGLDRPWEVLTARMAAVHAGMYAGAP